MPGKPKKPTRATLILLAEDLEHKITDAAGAASNIACEVDNGTNPKELADAWSQVEADLVAILDRVRLLAC